MKTFRWYAVVPFLMQVIAWIPARIILLFLTDFKVTGVENLKNIKGPIIIVSNHPNQIDPVLIRGALPIFSRFAPVFWISRSRSVYQWSGWKKILYTDTFYKVWGAPLVPKGLGDYSKSLETPVKILQDGFSFNIYPKSGEPNAKIHGGVGYLVAATQVPVVPMYISGTEQLTARALLNRSRKFSVTIGAPLSPQELSLTSTGKEPDYYQTGARKIMERVHDLV